MKVRKVICMFVSMLMMAGSFTLFVVVQAKAADASQLQDWEYSVLDDGTVELSGYNGNQTEIVIPSELDGKKITSIGYSAFANCTDLTSIKIPSSVTSIGNRAFNNCSSLTSIEIPSNVTYIGFAAFLGCDSLTSIEVPASVEIIGYAAFGYCSNLTHITVDSASLYYSSKDGILYDKDKTEVITCPAGKVGDVTIVAGVTSIADEAFSSCKKLTGVEIPAGVETIGNFAFMDCSGLTSLQIPSSVELINYKAFSGCTTALTFYGEADSYAEYFAYVNNIKFVVRNMPEETTTEEITTEETTAEETTTEETTAEETTTEETAAEDATTEAPTTEAATTETPTPVSTPKVGETFQDTKSKGQYKITGKQAVTYIKTTATSGKVTIPATVTYKGQTFKVTAVYKNAFQNKTGITGVILGDNITTIGASAFAGCTKLKKVTLNAKLTTIGNSAFSKCTALTSITIPKNVNKIGKQAFYGCKKLKSITISTTKLKSSNVGSNAFKGIHAKATIKVPKSKKTAYMKLLKSKGAGKNVVYK